LPVFAILPRGDDLARRQRRPVLHGDDSDAVDKDRLVRNERVGRLNRTADHDREETENLIELGLPAHQGLELVLATEIETVDSVVSDDDEEGQVQSINTLAENPPLSIALAGDGLGLGASGLADEERSCVLEVVACHDLAECLAGRERLSVAGVDVANPSLRHTYQGTLRMRSCWRQHPACNPPRSTSA
jgi:hypothetical protein